MSTELSIITGVISGIITSFVVWGVVIMFQKILISCYKVMIYSGVDISGVWKGYYVKENHDLEKPKIKLIIQQKAHKVIGEMIVLVHPNGKSDNKIFVAEGHFENDSIVLRIRSKERTRTGMGALVLQLFEDATLFKGGAMYTSSQANQLSSSDMCFFRSE